MKSLNTRLWTGIPGGLLVVGTLALFWQTSSFPFLEFDDNLYVTSNLAVIRGIDSGVFVRALTTNLVGNWQPMTFLSHALDVSLFGLNAGGHHLTSVFFHALNALLVFFLARAMKAGVGASFFAAALFAFHPLRVESVVWISERKDVLCSFFFLLGSILYLRSRGAQNCRAYLLVAIAFLLGLLSKPMIVTFPAVLLLLDFWPLKRAGNSPSGPDNWTAWRKVIFQKLPLFLIALGFSVVAVVAQRDADAIRDLQSMPMGLRLQTAVVALAAYLGKFFWPAGLSPFYTHPMHWSPWLVAGCLALLLALTAAAIASRSSRPWWLVGWLWYLGMLVPVIGIVQIGDQWMADRYTYLPMLGLVLAAVIEGEHLARKGPGTRWMVTFCACAFVAASCVLTLRQIPVWKDSETLSSRAISKDGGHWSMRTNHAISLANAGDMAGALREFEAIATAFPQDSESLNNFGFALLQAGRPPDAIALLRRAVANNPASMSARVNLANAFLAIGRVPEAIEQLQVVAKKDPDDPAAYFRLATIYSGANGSRYVNPQLALDMARRCSALTPRKSAPTLEIQGVAFMLNGNPSEAKASFREAVRLARRDGDSTSEKRVTARLLQIEQAQ